MKGYHQTDLEYNITLIKVGLHEQSTGVKNPNLETEKVEMQESYASRPAWKLCHRQARSIRKVKNPFF